MKKIILFFLIINGNLFSQYLKNEYPVVLQYSINNKFNIKISFSRNTDFEGAKSIFSEMSSFSFSLFRNPQSNSELVYSLNPLIWGISTLTNSGEMVNSGGGLPLFQLLLQGLPNSRVEIALYENILLSFGIDTDYLLARKNLGIRLGLNAGIKYQINRFSFRILYNMEGMAFVNSSVPYGDYNVRLEVLYDFSANYFSKFMYHCGFSEK